MNVIKNQTYKIDIISYASNGDGIGRIGGLVVFIKGAIVNETVEAKIIKVTKNCAWARLNKVIKKSNNRIEPDCKYALACGACSLRHMTYDEELKFKLTRVNDAFERIGKIDFSVTKINGDKQVIRYRNKAAFPVSEDKNGNIKIGLFQTHSHNVIDINLCYIQSESAEKLIEITKKWMHDKHITAYNESKKSGCIRHILVRTNYLNEILFCIVTSTNEKIDIADLLTAINKTNINCIGIIQNINPKNTNVILGQKNCLLYGQDYIFDKIGDLKFKLSLPSFFQVNRNQAEILYNKSMEYADIQASDTILDLYCGTGTISLFAAKQAKKVVGVEVVPEAIKDAIKNAQINNVANTEFICAKASEITEKFKNENFKPDIIFLDPPRKGLDEETINSVLQIAPNKIIYISCDPATLARDLQIFYKNNYIITKGECIDMFPRTPHIETVVKLIKSMWNARENVPKKVKT